MKADIEHLESNALSFAAYGKTDHISMTDHEFLSYIPLDNLIANQNGGSTLSCLGAENKRRYATERSRKGP